MFNSKICEEQIVYSFNEIMIMTDIHLLHLQVNLIHQRKLSFLLYIHFHVDRSTDQFWGKLNLTFML
jgi:hypothetical protein